MPKKSDIYSGRTRNKKSDKELYAFIASFFTIVGFLIALVLKREDRYVMYYANHGLILFIGQVIIMVVTPFWHFLSYVLWVFWAILWVLTWVNALSGKPKTTFIVTDLARKIRV